MKARATEFNKKLIWSGDLNVNPRKDDWSMQAFQRILDKYPPNTLPVRCRDEDHKAYGDMLLACDGVNVAEHVGKHGGMSIVIFSRVVFATTFTCTVNNIFSPFFTSMLSCPDC